MNVEKSRISYGLKVVIWVVLVSLTFFILQKEIHRPLANDERFISRPNLSNKRVLEEAEFVDDKICSDKPPPGTQMGENQIAAIRKAVNKGGNLLIWGLGNDSPYWHNCTRGKVVFIEPAGVWYKKILGKYPYLETYMVRYTTDIEKSFDKYINNARIWPELDLRPQLPPLFTETHWDVIVVDSPTGFKKGTPGRFQSIYTSSVIARDGTHIFVDDYERQVERLFSNKMLGHPIEVVDRPRRNATKNGQQAHFIIIK